MAPFAHALSIFAPIYGIWQAFRHFTLIDTVRRKADPAHGVDALTGAVERKLTLVSAPPGSGTPYGKPGSTSTVAMSFSQATAMRQTVSAR